MEKNIKLYRSGPMIESVTISNIKASHVFLI